MSGPCRDIKIDATVKEGGMWTQLRKLRTNLRFLRGSSGSPTIVRAGDGEEDHAATGLRPILLKVIMQVVLTVIVLIFGLHAVFWAEYPDELKKIAAGWVGFILGFWLR